MRSKGRGNMLAAPTRRGEAVNFLFNFGWSLCWLVRSVRRILGKRI